MDRAKAEVRDADILVWVTAPDVVSEVGPGREPDLHVFNKSDLKPAESIHVRNESEILVSIKKSRGLNLLRDRLKVLIHERSSVANSAVVVRDRHVSAVKETIRLLNDSLEDEKRPLELIAEDLRKATRALASITGRIDVEDLLGKIFSEFCIGK
jgi:tRNA modification GTPase